MGTFNSHEILVRHYIDQIESEWNWSKVEKEIKSNASVEEDTIVGRAMLGTVFGVMPSGKYWTFWTTNQTRSDVRRDTAFNDALEEVAERHGYFVDYFEDCIFFAKVLDKSDVIQFLTTDDEERAESLP